VDSQRIYSRTQTPKSDTSVWQTGHSGFIGIETIENSNRGPDEFDTNLELLKITYNVYYRELNRDITKYSCSL
jgi:hypothetical protein